MSQYNKLCLKLKELKEEYKIKSIIKNYYSYELILLRIRIKRLDNYLKKIDSYCKTITEFGANYKKHK